MAKATTQYVCNICGADFPKWAGQCPDCGAWNSLVEFKVSNAKSSKGYAGIKDTKIQAIVDIDCTEVPRVATDMGEFNRVLGGGLVPGSISLIGGDPGIGKSSILLQVLCELSQKVPALYVTGEESPEQVALRAQRVGLPVEKLQLLAETDVSHICRLAEQARPKVMVIDSIQTMQVPEISSAPGGVAQVRESAAALTRFAKQTGTTVLLVGHVTKSGEVAGPRVLEHIVDAVIYLEGQNDSRFRVMRAVKNRFGAINELGVFAMTDKGMKEVANPSAIFLSREIEDSSGSAVMVTWEGSRPLLVELQALVDHSHAPNPRRVCVGLEQNRLAMLLAVLHRHGGVPTHDQDVFVNVVGGMKVTETASDLAVLAAVVSSLKDKVIPPDTVLFGEVGLAGEIRPVQSGQERIKEAAKHGFKRIIAPSKNLPKTAPKGVELVGVNRLSQALQHV